MKKELKDLVRGELIGLTIEVVDAVNPSLVGKRGEVIDETKNMLVIANDGTTSRLVKDQVTIKADGIVLPGLMICARPEERTRLSSKKLKSIGRLVEKNARENKNKKSRE